jgi:hypothetical protein
MRIVAREFPQGNTIGLIFYCGRKGRDTHGIVGDRKMQGKVSILASYEGDDGLQLTR